MPETLRPMSTGEVLDRTFNLYRHHFLLFFAIAMVGPGVLLVIQIGSSLLGQAGPSFVGHSDVVTAIGVVGILVGVLAYLIGFSISQGATIYAVSALHLGRTTTISESFARLRGRYGRVINVMLSVWLRVFGGGALLMMAAIIIGTTTAIAIRSMGMAGVIIVSVVAIVLAIVAAVLSISLFVRYSLAVQACVLEDIKARAALRRSAILAKGSRNRILTVYTLAFLVTLIVSWTLVLPVSFWQVSTHGSLFATIVSHVVGFLSGALVGPVVAIAMSLLYYDERVRKEAFDIEWMMTALDGPSAATSPSTAG